MLPFERCGYHWSKLIRVRPAVTKQSWAVIYAHLFAGIPIRHPYPRDEFGLTLLVLRSECSNTMFTVDGSTRYTDVPRKRGTWTTKSTSLAARECYPVWQICIGGEDKAELIRADS